MRFARRATWFSPRTRRAERPSRRLPSLYWLSVEPLESRRLLTVDAVDDYLTVLEDTSLYVDANVYLASRDPNVSFPAAPPDGSAWKFLVPWLNPNDLNQDGIVRTNNPSLFDSSDATWFASPAYGDENWTGEGPSPLGYGSDSIVTNVGWVDTDPITAGRQSNITTYFRRHVSLIQQEVDALTGAGSSLQLQMRVDDGAAVYLNGYEIMRVNLAANATYNTVATTQGNNGAGIRSAALTPLSHPAVFASLRAGDNVLAAEMHQIGSLSQDTFFDFETFASAYAISPILQNDTGIAAGAVTKLVELPQHGSLFNRYDTRLASGDVLEGGGFRYEPVSEYNGPDSFVYQIDNGGGDVDTATVHFDVQPVNDPPSPAYDVYTVAKGQPIYATVAGADPAAPIPAGSVWNYRFDGTSLDGTGQFDPQDALWFASPLYSDEDWQSEPAVLGYDIGGLTTDLGNSTPGYITTYFRRTFDADPATPLLHVLMRLGDGAAVYINGVEAARINLPPGATFATLAGFPNPGGYVTANWDEWVDVAVDLGTSGITLSASGTGNVIAVECHQKYEQSGGLGFDMQLSTTAGRMGVLSNDRDIDGTAITGATLADSTEVDAVGTLDFHGDGTFTFMPDDPNLTGRFSFTYRAIDSGIPLPPAQSEPATVVLNFVSRQTSPDRYRFG